MNNTLSSTPYAICRSTVMDTSDPCISFDTDGYSNHHWDFHHNVLPNWHTGNHGALLLKEQIHSIKLAGINKPYDCILGLSGGLDSSYMLHKAVTEFGLRPLVFHVDAGWNTDASVKNINKLVSSLNLDLFTEVVNWKELRDFQLALFKSGVPHLDLPQDLAFIGVLYKYAQKHSIKYILNGGNISTECVQSPLDILYYGTDTYHVKSLLKRFGTIKMKTFPFSSVLYHKLYLRYFRGIKVVKPLNFIPFVKKDAVSELSSIYGWLPFAQKHFESRFTRFFEGYWLPTRFGFDMRRVQLSSLILTNQISRDQALAILERPALSQEVVDQESNFVAAKLDISLSQLMKYYTQPLKYYYNYPNMKLFMSFGEKVYSSIFKGRRGGCY